MKKITSLFALLFLWIGAQCVWAQAYMPKASTAETVYEYYVQNAGNNAGHYCTTTVGIDGCVSFGNSGDRLKVKFVSTGTEGEYNIVPTNVEGMNIIGVTGTDEGAVVKYFSTTGEATNSVFLLKEETSSNAAAYKHAFDIYPKGATRGWNMFGGISNSVIKLYNNGDQGSKWNLVPANAEAVNAVKEAMSVAISDVAAATDGFTLFNVLSGYTFSDAANYKLTTGYYRLRNYDTTSSNKKFGAYLFSDSKKEFGLDLTLGNVPDDDKLLQNNYIWHITRDGQSTSIGILSGQGLGILNGQEVKTLNLGTNDFWDGGAYYFNEGLHLSNQGHLTVNGGALADAAASKTNPFKITGWAHSDSKGSCYTFEEVDASNIYNVVVEGNENGIVTLVNTGEIAKNGGFFYSTTAITSESINVSEIDNCEKAVTISGKTIKVVYTPIYSKLLPLAIENAQAVLNSVPENVIGYQTGTARTALSSAISTAKEVEPANATELDYNTLLAAIDAFTTTADVVLPTDGSYVRIKNYARDLNIDNADHPGSGGYVTSNNEKLDAYGTLAEIGVSLQTIDDAAAVWQITATDETATFKLYNLNSKKYMGKTSSDGNSQYVPLVESEEEAGTYVLATTTAYPQFSITCTNAEGNNMKQLHASGSGVMNYATANGMNDPSAWIVSEATAFDVTLNKANDTDTESYASIYLPFNVTLPASGVTANKGVANAGNTEFTLTSVGSGVPAENGVILVNSEAAASVTLGITQNEVTADMGGNDLTGTLVKKNMEETASYYFLGVNDALIAGMYRPAAALTQIPANKAYLEEVGGSVQGYRFSFGGETTGIGGVDASAQQPSGACYDLSGRRVQNPRKGVYIIGNRKVVLK